MRTLTLAGASLRRLTRDRTSLFFLLVLPVLVILVIGTVVRQSDSFRVGLVDRGAGDEGGQLTTALHAASALRVRTYDDMARARTALRRGELDTVVVLPAGMDATLAGGGQAEVQVLADRTNGTERAAAQAVAAVVTDRAARLQAAHVYQGQRGGTLADALAAVDALAPTVPPVTVTTTTVDSKSDILPGGFSYSAPTMLTLFVFITSLAGGAAMIETRRLGIHDRMLAAPVTAGRIVVGESFAYFAVAIVQSVIIVGVGSLVFGVRWGDPAAAAALVAVWALVGTGTGMLAGTLFRTPEQATAIGVTVGMAAGMLGGCMWPLEIVPSAMRTLGHAVPHAWAVDGWVKILSHGAGLWAVLPQLAVLAVFAVALLAVASVRLRTRLTG